MSSIYKKGRDGYFYYQTYVFNKETGKKNKKVFHSLGTKDYNKALEKKEYYDSLYNKKNKTGNKVKKFINNRGKYFFPVLCFTLIIMISYCNYDGGYDASKTDYYSSFDPYSQDVNNSNLNEDVDSAKTDSEPENTTIIEVPLKYANVLSESIDSTKRTVPEYSIHKVEMVDNAFNQIKINVTCEVTLDQSQLKLVCRDIKNDYKKYTNIIICIYANIEKGIMLANGVSQKDINSNNKKLWLVMYSYNPVEGEYFDNDPGVYN